MFFWYIAIWSIVRLSLLITATIRIYVSFKVHLLLRLCCAPRRRSGTAPAPSSERVGRAGMMENCGATCAAKPRHVLVVGVRGPRRPQPRPPRSTLVTKAHEMRVYIPTCNMT